MENENEIVVIKIVLVGNSGTGKSSLVSRFCDDIFPDEFVPTIGMDYRIKTLQSGQKTFKIQIWDTAGQEKFKTLNVTHYKNCKGIFIVYDITDKISFEGVDYWIQDIKKSAPSLLQILLIGNKSDLTSERQVRYEVGEYFAFDNLMGFMETSTKTGQGVQEAFRLMIEDLMKKQDVVQSDELGKSHSLQNPAKGKNREAFDKDNDKSHKCC